MMSAFVWLDYSERERREMLDIVDLFREHDKRDELGVGSVRDAFADMLFPGTSTIMTRDHDTSAVLSSRPLGLSEAGKTARQISGDSGSRSARRS
jgi:hypothetical protein